MFSKVTAFSSRLSQLSHVRRITLVYVMDLSGGLLYPFRFTPPVSTETNNVQWLSQPHRVVFSHTGIIQSMSPLQELYQSLVSGDGLTIEVWLATKTFYQEGSARIISYSLDRYNRNFTLGNRDRAS